MAFSDYDNIEGTDFSDWRNPYLYHPQGSLLKEHVERAVQDIFFVALKEQSPDLFYIFTDEPQVDSFINKMVSYWESLEEYERCSEIIDLGKIFRIRWRTEIEKNTESPAKIKEWLKDHFNV